MQRLSLFAILIIGCLSNPATAASPNVLLICIDDLRPELNCFGKSYIQSPHIDALAATGVSFHRHYVQAPTCGASRFAMLTGCYGPSGNGALFTRAGNLKSNPDAVSPSMPHWFGKHGYQTVSVGKVSHHPGGRGGPNWDQNSQLEMPKSWDRYLLPVGDWQHPRGVMHGLAHGEIREHAGTMDVFQSVDGPDTIYPDGLITEEAVEQMKQLAGDDKPFFLAVGIIRPHLPFGAPARYMTAYRDLSLPPIAHRTKPKGKTTWHRSGEFMKYNRWGKNPNDDEVFATQVRKHYAACVSYADAQVGRLLAQLTDLGRRDNTIVVLWGDHGWHLGEHAIWGKHALFEESLRSPLIINAPEMERRGLSSKSIVESIDIFPTLCDLADLPPPSFVDGQSLRPQMESLDDDGGTAVSYARAKTIRTNTHRLILHSDGHAELYDHTSADGETKNIAADSHDLVGSLISMLHDRLKSTVEPRSR